MKHMTRMQWRAVEDAIYAMSQPELELVKAQLLDVLITNYSEVYDER